MNSKFYTIKEIAEILEVGESTVRYWRDQYHEFIPFTGEGRKRRYPENAVDVLRFTAECAKSNMNSDEIKKALVLGFRSEEGQTSEKTPSTSTVTKQIPLSDDISDKILERFDKLYEVAERTASILGRIAIAVERLAEQSHTAPPDHQEETKIEIQTEGSDSKPESQITLEDIDEREKVIQKIETLLAQGLSYQKIADRLNQDGVSTFSGKGKWHGKTISRMLKQK